MGWFFNNNNNRNQQNNSTDQDQANSNNNSFFQTKTSSSFYSKKRRCQNDPDDNQYMICKTIIKDNNGTRQEEQRIPKNSQYAGSSFQESSSWSSSGSGIFGPFFNRDNNKQRQSQQQKVFDKFPSFFIQPSFFDFHNTTPQNPHLGHQGNQPQGYVYTYGRSKVCQPDPQNDQYLICKQEINDGNQTKQIQQRIKISDQVKVPSFGKQFMNLGTQVDKQIHQLMKQLHTGFNSLIPFIGPMMGFINALDPNNMGRNHSQHGTQMEGDQYNTNRFGNSRRERQQNSSRYFSQNEKKDTNIYDL